VAVKARRAAHQPQDGTRPGRPDLDGDDAVRAAARSLLALTAGEDAVLLVERMVQERAS